MSSALARWRGSVLEEFVDAAFAQPTISRLEELRVAALGHRIEADLLLGGGGELIGELDELRQHHPHREQFVGQHMLALYRSGRQADALRTFQDFRQRLVDDLGLDPSPELRRLEEQVLLHDQRIQRRPRHPPDAAAGQPDTTANPFKGLRPFDEDDTARFFGREALTADVVRRIDAGARFVALVGPSGSGKSSIVRAGVVPALRKHEHGGTAPHWIIAHMVPGSHPFVELGVALSRAALDTPADLAELLRASELGVLQAALRALPDDRSRLLLVIDQFEELFTLVDDEADRRDFLDQLLPFSDGLPLLRKRLQRVSIPVALVGLERGLHQRIGPFRGWQFDGSLSGQLSGHAAGPRRCGPAGCRPSNGWARSRLGRIVAS